MPSGGRVRSIPPIEAAAIEPARWVLLDSSDGASPSVGMYDAPTGTLSGAETSTNAVGPGGGVSAAVAKA